MPSFLFSIIYFLLFFPIFMHLCVIVECDHFYLSFILMLLIFADMVQSFIRGV